MMRHTLRIESSNVVGIISSRVKEETLKKREAAWESRLVTTANLDHSKRKDFLRSEASLRLSESQLKKSSESNEPSRSQSSSKISQSSKMSPPLPIAIAPSISVISHRAEMELSENDLIANGLYSFSSEQEQVFDDFTTMLSSFDHYDMVTVLLFFFHPSLG